MLSTHVIRRFTPTTLRCFSQMQMHDHLTMRDMKQSKHEFVSFVNKATLDKKSGESRELYNFLVECFIDNDTDYDGQVSFNGFNSMIAEAATAPRRFGFAPHTRELYESKEHYEAERMALFNQLRGTDERVKLESWLAWASAHISEKVGDGLEEHGEGRWERSKADYISFIKGVMTAKSEHNPKSSTSTQLKEHYMNSIKQYMACDVECNGKMDEPAFKNLMAMCQKVPAKHGLELYHDVHFKDVSSDGKTVTMKDFLDFKFAYLSEKLPSLALSTVTPS